MAPLLFRRSELSIAMVIFNRSDKILGGVGIEFAQASWRRREDADT
jgi:hypothetical protein